MSENLLLEIHYGEGGEDSKLFVHDLAAAYCKYAETNKCRVELVQSDHGHVILKITGDSVWDLFGQEAGNHVVQRVPPTETRGRKQTSIVSVGVLPILPKTCTVLDPRDVEITTCRGTGPGGQHRNTTDSAVRCRHLPTGLEVVMDNRSQHQNRRDALEILTTRVQEYYSRLSRAEQDRIRFEALGQRNRGGKVRTYNWLESRAVDHRTGLKTSNLKAIFKQGKFELLLTK